MSEWHLNKLYNIARERDLFWLLPKLEKRAFSMRHRKEFFYIALAKELILVTSSVILRSKKKKKAKLHWGLFSTMSQQLYRLQIILLSRLYQVPKRVNELALSGPTAVNWVNWREIRNIAVQKVQHHKATIVYILINFTNGWLFAEKECQQALEWSIPSPKWGRTCGDCWALLRAKKKCSHRIWMRNIFWRFVPNRHERETSQWRVSWINLIFSTLYFSCIYIVKI